MFNSSITGTDLPAMPHRGSALTFRDVVGVISHELRETAQKKRAAR
jgi:hypothetical protein